MNEKLDYKYLKSKVSDFFCVENLREIYDMDKYDFRVSFLDFLLCIEDFYTFVYSPRLSKNAWLLFTWLRTLVRYDGYVRLSYKDVSSKFNNGKSVMMSKPTFFKCVSELESYGLVKRVSNKKLFDAKYQNDVNTYIVISKIDDIVPLLNGMKTQSEFYGILRKEFFSVDKKEVKKKTTTSATDKISGDKIMEEYKLVKQELLDLFSFLGSANKSGRIAKTRQENILNVIYEFYPHEDDLSYAISQTISKGVKNEKYLYAILRNMLEGETNEEVSTNDVDSKLKDKYKAKTTYSQKPNGISQEQYIQFRTLILSKKSGYKKVLQKFKETGIIDKGTANAQEQRLYDVCVKLKAKEDLLKQASYIRGDRMAILEKHNIYEYVGSDKRFNEVIHWCYNSDDSVVPLSVIKELSKKHPSEFKLCGAQLLNSEVY